MKFFKYKILVIGLIIVIIVNLYLIFNFEKLREKILADQPNLPPPRKIQNIKNDYLPLVELNEKEKQEFIESMKLDLNTAVIDELVKISGIGPGTAKKIIKYRKENGPFKSIEDLLNVPGIGETKFNSFKEYITVRKSATELEETEKKEQEEKKITAPPPPNQKKIKMVYSDKVDINSADLEELMSVEGIGKNMAQRIIDYREINNGFKTIEELSNVKGISSARVEKLKPHLELKPYKKKIWKPSDIANIEPMNLNTCNYLELRQLPYISVEIANAILEFRKKHGKFNSVNDLRKIKEIDYTTFTHIKKMFFVY